MNTTLLEVMELYRQTANEKELLEYDLKRFRERNEALTEQVKQLTAGSNVIPLKQAAEESEGC